MLKAISDMLILTLLLKQVTYISGRLITLRNTNYSNKSKVICLSEDDGSALVWNGNVSYNDSIDPYKKGNQTNIRVLSSTMQ